MKLIEFDVEGFRSLLDVGQIPVDRLTVFTGCNDGGKTSALTALKFLLERDNPRSRPKDDRRLISAGRHELKVTGLFRTSDDERKAYPELPGDVRITRIFRMDGQRTARYQADLLLPDDDELRDLDEASRRRLTRLVAKYGLNHVGYDEDAVRAAVRDYAKSAPRALREVADIERSPYSPVLDLLPKIITFASATTFDETGYLASVLEDLLRDKSRANQVETALGDVAEHLKQELRTTVQLMASHVAKAVPEVADLLVDFDLVLAPTIERVRARVGTEDGVTVPLGELGTGRRRRVALALWEWSTEILARAEIGENVIITYDEPEANLDYGRQREFMAELHDRVHAESDVRVIVATHSVAMIDRVDPESIVDFQLDDQGHSRIRRLMAVADDTTATTHLTDLASSLGLTNSAWLTKRLFVLVEGPSEKRALPHIFRLVTGHRPQTFGIEILSIGGNVEIGEIVQRLKHFDLRYHCVIDRDSLNQGTQAAKKFAEGHLRTHQVPNSWITALGTQEFEDLFTDAQWAAVANRRWPRSDGAAWTPQRFAPLRATAKFSGELAALVAHDSQQRASKPDLAEAVALELADVAEVPDELADLCWLLKQRATS